MKSTDIALIILIAAISIGISFWVTNAVLGDPADSVVEVNYVDDISGIVADPDPETFNNFALNPTSDVIIGCDAGKTWVSVRCVDNDKIIYDSNGNIDVDATNAGYDPNAPEEGDIPTEQTDNNTPDNNEENPDENINEGI